MYKLWTASVLFSKTEFFIIYPPEYTYIAFFVLLMNLEPVIFKMLVSAHIAPPFDKSSVKSNLLLINVEFTISNAGYSIVFVLVISVRLTLCTIKFEV